jgi:hypothetical protein
MRVKRCRVADGPADLVRQTPGDRHLDLRWQPAGKVENLAAGADRAGLALRNR